MSSEVDLRPATAADAEAINALYNHYVTTSAVTFDVEPSSLEWRQQWLRDHPPTGSHRIFVAECDGVLCGYASSSRFRPKAAYDTSVETTVYLDPGFTGRGIGPSLYGTLFDALAREDVHRAYAGVTLPNPASVALHLRLGFHELALYREVGRKHGRYWSVRWFEKDL